MNTHKNARLTFARRLEMVQDVTQRGLSQAAAGLAQGVSEPAMSTAIDVEVQSGRSAFAARRELALPIAKAVGQQTPTAEG